MKRLQFDFHEERVEELDALIERTGIKTRVQLFNSALTLFEWAIREREAGHIITAMDEKMGKYKEVVMPGFPPVEEVIPAASVPSATDLTIPTKPELEIAMILAKYESKGSRIAVHGKAEAPFLQFLNLAASDEVDTISAYKNGKKVAQIRNLPEAPILQVLTPQVGKTREEPKGER